MRDVLENLKKLPPKCAAVMNGRPVIIHRGSQHLGCWVGGKDQVDQYNARNGISPQQVQAMIVGVTMGWDKDGADPDTHHDTLSPEDPQGPFSYEFQAEITVTIKPVGYHTLDQATHAARAVLSTLCDQLNENSPVAVAEGFAPSDTLDLVDTDDPN